MFDFAWSELMVIGVVALVVIGPKDLPKALRTLGVFMRRARRMAREFQNSFDDIVREAELGEVRRELREATRIDLGKHVELQIDPGGEMRSAFEPGTSPPAVPPLLPPDPASTQASTPASAQATPEHPLVPPAP